MGNRFGWGMAGALVAVLAAPVWGAPQDTSAAAAVAVWDAAQLKKALEDIGYETKVLNATVGKEKYEFVVEKSDLKIPIGAEISGSKNYLWLTVKLADAPKNFADKGEKLGALLKANSKVQPCQFYITDGGALMIALPVENRALTNPILRRRIDFLADRVVEQKALWQE